MPIRSYDIIRSDPGLDSEAFLRKKCAKAIKDSITGSSETSAVLLQLLVAPSFDGDELATRRRKRGGDVGATALKAVMKLGVIGFDKSPARATGDITIGADEDSDREVVRGWGMIERGEDDRLKLFVSDEEQVNPEETGKAAMKFIF